MIFNPGTAPYIGPFYLPSLETAAQSLGVTVELAPVHSDAEIETVITALGREPGGGLLAMPDNFIDAHRASIVALAARNNVPAVYQTPSSAKGRRFAFLWSRLPGYLSACRPVCGQHPAWCKAV